jgi:hypothetical protein
MNNSRHLITASLAFFLVCAGCKPNPVAQQYQKDGVQFTYYSDWKIAKDAPAKGNANVRAIHIEGPHNAVVSLICEPVLSPQSLEEFAAAVAERRGAAIESKLSVGSLKTATVSKGTSEPNLGNVAGRQRPGIFQRFSVDMLGTQVLHEARFYTVEGSKDKIMVMAQVAVNNIEETRQGFDLILTSLSVDGMH